MQNNKTLSLLNQQINAIGQALIPGLFSGVLVVILSVSFASLIFSGNLSGYIVEGISLAINTAIIAGLGIAFFSRCRPAISMVDEDTAPVFALLASFVVASVPSTGSPDEVFITAIAAIIATTLISGAGLALLGFFRFGAFIQFLPHSVMGGYFSAVGWLLVVGGLRVGAASNLQTWDELAQLITPGELAGWLPAVAIAAVLIVLKSRIPRNILLPSTVLLAILTWYLVLWAMGSTPGDAMHKGLLLGPFELGNEGLINPLAGLDFMQVNWMPLIANGGSVASVFLIAVMSLLLSINGLGFLTRTEPDMNQELKIAGLANIASGLGGGMIGLPSYSLSALAKDLGGNKNRQVGLWVGILTVLVCALVFMFGLGLVAYIPRFILAGILIYLGFALLHEWLIEGWQKFARLEYMVIPFILVVSITAGFLEGIFIGLVAAIVLFVVKYSRTRVVRYTATGAQLMSNVDRTPDAQDYLRKNGDRILVLGLQGYLFFGTAGRVYSRLQERLADRSLQPLKFLVIDFTHVTGLDASASLSFQKMSQLAESKDFRLVIAGLGKKLHERLHKGGFVHASYENLPARPDLDRTLEWYENLQLVDLAGVCSVKGCFEQLEQYLSHTEIKKLMDYLEKREVDAGQMLAEQGEASDELYFMETCSGSAYIKNAKGDLHRIRRTTRGTVFGELGFYLRIPRTAYVMTDEAGVIYVLNHDALMRMEDDNPEVAAGLHRYMAMLLSERLMLTTRTLRAMLM
jgi:SulP family sulfate permease